LGTGLLRAYNTYSCDFLLTISSFLLYLPRKAGEKSQRTERHGESILIDYGNGGQPIGIEFLAPDQLGALLSELNQALSPQNIPPVEPHELIPLVAA